MTRRDLKFAVIAFSASALCSCATMKTVHTSTIAGVSKMGESVGSGFDTVAKVTTAPFRPGLPVVEARPDDLQAIPSGQEQALAYQEELQRRRGWWIFGGSVDFEEPALPDDPSGMDVGLLPPVE